MVVIRLTVSHLNVSYWRHLERTYSVAMRDQRRGNLRLTTFSDGGPLHDFLLLRQPMQSARSGRQKHRTQATPRILASTYELKSALDVTELVNRFELFIKLEQA